jgi:beta-glucanase (GH16 family)
MQTYERYNLHFTLNVLRAVVRRHRLLAAVLFFAGPLTPAFPHDLGCSEESQLRVLRTLDGTKLALSWLETFDGALLDESKWSTRNPGPRDNSIVSEGASSLSRTGLLRLTTSISENKTFVGMIGTQGKFEQRYGYFEARIKFQKSQGHHGAFWLHSQTYGVPKDNPAVAGAEIDVVEYFGDGRSDSGLVLNVYWDPYEKPEKRTSWIKHEFLVNKLKPWQGFNCYGVLWLEDRYVFFVNGREIFRTSDGVSRRPQFLILSLLSSPWEETRLPRHLLPETMEVDYVAVYKLKQ